MRIEIIPCVVYLLPAFGKNAYLRIAVFAVCLDKTRVFYSARADAVGTEIVIETFYFLNSVELFAVQIVGIIYPSVGNGNAVHIGFAVCPETAEDISAFAASENTVCDCIAVSFCLERSAPIHHGIAYVAECSACISAFRAGSGFIFHSMCGMYVTAVPCIEISLAFGSGYHILCHFVHFGIHLRTFARECIGCSVRKYHYAAVYFHADIDGPEFFHAFELSISESFASLLCSARVGIACFQLPCTYRERSENGFARAVVFACARDCYRGYIFIVLYGVGSGEAFCRRKMGELPSAHIVEVDIYRNALHLFYISGDHIDIPYGAEFYFIQRRIVSHYLYSGFSGAGIYIYRAYHRSIIALIVAYGKFDMVQSVRQHNIGNRHHAVLECAGEFHAVYICLCRSGIDTREVSFACIVGNFHAEAESIVADSLTVQRSGIGHGRRSISHVAEYGRFSVVHRIGIVHRDIVHIHHVSAVIGFVLIVIVTVACAVAVGNVKLYDIALMQIKSRISIEIYRKIVPAGLAILIYKSRSGSDTVRERICDQGIPLDVFAGIVFDERKYCVANPSGNILVGNINPHAESCGVFKGFLVSVVKQSCHHIAGFQRIAVIYIKRHGTVSAVNFAGRRCHMIYSSFGKRIIVRFIAEYKIADISVLEIEYHFAAFAERYLRYRGNIRADKFCRDRAGCAAVGSGESKSVYRTDSIVGKRECNIGSFEFDCIEPVSGCERESNRFSERNSHFCAVESDALRNNAMNRERADFFSVVHGGDGNIACRSRREDTVFISAVCRHIRNIIGYGSRCARRGNACHRHINGCAGSDVFFLRTHGDMVERI